MSEPDNANTPLIAVIGIVGTLLTIAIVLALHSLYMAADENERFVKDVSRAPEELSNLRAEQLGQLNGYRWRMDNKNRVVAIPIDRAMDLTVQEFAKSRASAGAGTNAPATR
jgi:hypothetical protein